jgi:cell division transport system permease protein
MVSILTITGALFVLGIFLVCYQNLDHIASKTNPRITGTAYLIDGLTSQTVDEIYESIVLSEGVQRATFKDKKQVLTELDSVLGSVALTSIPGGELFPDVIEIELKENAKDTQVEALKNHLMTRAEIAEVDFSDGWLQQYHKLRNLLKVVGFILLGGMLIACSMIIANFMGMRHQSRREEMDIVQLMGAQRSFILWPFLWEGILEGWFGAVFSLAALYACTVTLSHYASVQWASLLEGRSLVFLTPMQSVLLATVGILMALGGSLTVFFRFQSNSN